jgi:uncharacterized membrane protein YuzA (DUF378 family)
MYMGKIIVGIAALLLIAGVYAMTALVTALYTWIGINAIMAIDMIIGAFLKQ